MYTIIIAIVLILIFVVVMTKSSISLNEKLSIEGLKKTLAVLGVDYDQTEIECLYGNAKWSGIINGENVGLEYFSDYKISGDSLTIKIPFCTQTNFYIKNTNIKTPFDKKDFEQANEISLKYIKNDNLRDIIKNLLEDNRFVKLNVRMDSHERKIVSLPKYGKNNKIVNNKSQEETDSLAVSLICPDKFNRDNAPDLDRDFLYSVIILLKEVRTELK